VFPDFHYLFKGLFGIDIPALSIIKTFGFLVAIAFIAGAWVLKKELQRKKEQGLFKPEIVTRKNKKTGKEERIALYPHDRVVDIIFIAAITGFIGAKIFNAFETWDDFIHDPVGNLFSPAGLTFYGGLIFATVALYIYSRKKRFSFVQLCDAAAPALILAYAIGRLGCQTAGDGDWGIYNSAYITQADASLVQAPPQTFDSLATMNRGYFEHEGKIYAKYYPAPAGIPRWMVAMNYPHNVNRDGVEIKGDDGEYNTVLPVSVFPTPIYETIACLLIFFILWGIRRRIDVPLRMFGIYLVFNGIERFFIEKIRVNYKYDWGFLHPTQAEIIAVGLILTGLAIVIFIKKKNQSLPANS
jgi:phosphatidylglycerol:prolipoprotein diacylglycerol transferase